MTEKFVLRDGKRVLIRKFLFQRYSEVYRRGIPVCVEALNYDQAVSVLLAEWPGIVWRDWDYIMELEPEHDLGKLGKTITFKEPN